MQDKLLRQFLLAMDDLDKGSLSVTYKGLEGQVIYRRGMVNSGILEEWNDVFEIDK
jgi:hypothetical protein